MRRLFVPMISVLMFGALVGCGSGSPNYPYYEEPSLTAPNPPAAVSLAEQGSVSCADPSDCHESVALLTSVQKNEVKMCTGFLMGPNLAATNSHCIPDDLKTPGSSCSKRIWLFFPKTASRDAVRAECANVEFASELEEGNTLSPDFALIRLSQPVDRQPVVVSPAGFPDETEMRVVRASPISSTDPVAVIEKTLCTTKQFSFHNPTYVGSHVPIVNAACTLIHGNSGSPVFDGQGQVRGIVYAISKTEVTKNRIEKGDSGVELLDGALSDMAFITSFSCIDSPLVPLASAAVCASITDDEAEKRRDAKAEAELSSAISELNKDQMPLSDVLNWQVQAIEPYNALNSVVRHQVGSSSSTSTNHYYAFVPRCFSPGEGWLSRYKRGWFLEEYETTAKIEVSLSVWKIREGVDRFLRPKLDLVDTWVRVRNVVEFNPQSVFEKRQSPYEVRVMAEGDFSDAKLWDGDLRFCSDFSL